MDNLTEQIDRLFAENRGPEAEKLLEQALKEAYENQYFLDAVPILNELIGYCRETSQVERSYAYAEEVQEILQKLAILPHAHAKIPDDKNVGIPAKKDMRARRKNNPKN